MATRELLQRRRRIALPIVAVVAAVAAAAVPRSAAQKPVNGTRITNVSVEHRGGESSVVAVTFDGAITGRRWFRVSGEEPRAVVRIIGITEAYRPYEVTVGDERVQRVRIGHHPEFDPPEEHLVFDLVDNSVAITRVMDEDRRLIVVLGRPDTSDGPQPPAPITPTPAPLVPRAVPATPIPTAIPTATPPPATPTPPPPTATPTSPIPPDEQRNAQPTPPPTPPQPSASDRRVTATPRPPAGLSAPLLSELVVSHRQDGSALVRVTADRPIEGTEVRYFGVKGSPPRHILVIVGVRLPGEDAVLPVRDGILCEIGVAFKEDKGTARTELTFYLASSEVTPNRAAVKGAHAVVHLLPPEKPQASLGCEVESPTRVRSWRFTTSGQPQEVPAEPR